MVSDAGENKARNFMRGGLAVLLILVAVSPVAAATRYAFTITSEGAYPVEHHGTVLVEEDGRWRIDFDWAQDEVRSYDSIVGGVNGERFALNNEDKSWYQLKSSVPVEGSTSRLFSFAFGTPPRVSRIRVEVFGGQPPVSIIGLPAFKKTVKFSYQTMASVGREQVRGHVNGQIVIWVTEEPMNFELPISPADVTSEIESVDAALKPVLAALGGTALRSEVTVTRALDGGQPMTEVIRRTIADMRPATASTGDFEIPSNYQNREPVIIVPGRQKRSQSLAIRDRRSDLWIRNLAGW